MKFLLVMAVVLVAFWIWRNNRLGDREASRPPTPPRAPQSPAIMVACAHCGMHLPDVETVQGRSGVYCCQEHRRLSEEAGT
jgi:uncharacterized protein